MDYKKLLTEFNAYTCPVDLTTYRLGKREWRLVERQKPHPDLLVFKETNPNDPPDIERVMHPSELQHLWEMGLVKVGYAERRAPVQADGYSRQPGYVPPGTITWEEHMQVYACYAKRYGTSQSAERLAERAGFGKSEAETLLGRPLTTWEPRL